MNLEPKAEAFVAAFAAANLPPFEQGSPNDARRLAAALKVPGEPRHVAEVTDHRAPGPPGGVPVRVYRPAETVPGCILYFHGGGWVLGGIEDSDPFARELAVETGWAVASVDYRLAPEAPYPAAADDAEASLDWLAGVRKSLFGQDVTIVVLGDSAGGNLAAVVSIRARDCNGPVIAAQILAYPVTDAAMDTPSYREFADGPLLTAPLMAWFWAHYIADSAARAGPGASPLHASSLAGLPPAFVLTAENDPLRDEGEAYATALSQAGVRTRAQRYDGQIHSFLTFVGMFDGGARALGDIADFLRDLISTQPGPSDHD